MPLPKSILCSACTRTYPEGWLRCPYCGHDPVRMRREADAARRLRAKLAARGGTRAAESQRPGRGKGKPRPGGRRPEQTGRPAAPRRPEAAAQAGAAPPQEQQ
ncbi:MAG: hypothetical protein ACRD2J_02825, partial [Thermoanaerobaculia bacterium]